MVEYDAAAAAEAERQRREAAGLPAESPDERAAREQNETQDAGRPDGDVSPGEVDRSTGEAAVIPAGSPALREGETPQERADRLRDEVAAGGREEKERLGQSTVAQQGVDPETGQPVGAPPPLAPEAGDYKLRTGVPDPMPQDQYDATVRAQQEAQAKREAEGAPAQADRSETENAIVR
jgi:hypothetical protein